MTLQIIGAISNFLQDPSATPQDRAHDEGLTFVAMDVRSFAHWNGAIVSNEWNLRRVLRKRLDQLQPWPETGWRFRDEAQARQAYMSLRQHFLTRLPGAQLRPELLEGQQLLAGQQAWAEGVYFNGELVAWIACDLSTDALSLTRRTSGLIEFKPEGGPEARCASYATQLSRCYLAVAPGPQGVYDHALIVFSPGDEEALIQQGLLGAAPDGTAEQFCVDIPSGILILAWGRIAGSRMLGGGGDPAAKVHAVMGNQLHQAASTELDARAASPLVWALRMTPGVYDTNYWFVDTDEGGISCMVLSRQGAQPFRPAQAPAPAMAGFGPGVVGTLQLADGRVFNVPGPGAPNMAPHELHDPDPVVFPGQPVARLSEYVALMKAMQTGDVMAALQRAGLSSGAYSEIVQRWSQAMASDMSLGQKMAAMMMQG